MSFGYAFFVCMDVIIHLILFSYNFKCHQTLISFYCSFLCEFKFLELEEGRLVQIVFITAVVKNRAVFFSRFPEYFPLPYWSGPSLSFFAVPILLNFHCVPSHFSSPWDPSLQMKQMRQCWEFVALNHPSPYRPSLEILSVIATH